MDTIVAWATALMVSWAPPGKSKIKDAIETPEEGKARYEEIAKAVERVAFDPSVKPLYKGDRARSQTMALLLSIAYHESGFRKDVDLGIGKLARGSGLDSCVMQVRVGAGKTQEGWTHKDLVSDREKCFRAALAIVRRSFNQCRKLDQLDWLGGYTRGRCVPNEPFSRSRVGLARKAPRAPVPDAEVAIANAPPAPRASL